jgi:hypothetical protein
MEYRTLTVEVPVGNHVVNRILHDAARAATTTPHDAPLVSMETQAGMVVWSWLTTVLRQLAGPVSLGHRENSPATPEETAYALGAYEAVDTIRMAMSALIADNTTPGKAFPDNHE